MKLSATTRAGGLAFLTGAVTLFTQVLIHRIVSAKLLNNYAFLVISLTMLGFALSGIVLSRWLDRLLEHFEDSVTTCVALFIVSVIATSGLFYHLDVGHQFAIYRRDFLVHLGRWMPVALPFALPFLFCGLILGTLLSDPRLPARRMYFADLLGSATGAIAVIYGIKTLGVERSLLGACAVMLTATVLVVPPRRGWSRGAAVVAAAAIVVSAMQQDRVFAMQYPTDSMLWQMQRLPKPYGIEYVAWDPVTRIEVSRIETPSPESSFTPSLIGDN
ncbi:MAG TPA: hypothetical protein VKI41_19090, partial [Vicinamibacteria bacterium]|nr:hypothetical protein [Vicinamibacteria bacterium]